MMLLKIQILVVAVWVLLPLGSADLCSDKSESSPDIEAYLRGDLAYFVASSNSIGCTNPYGYNYTLDGEPLNHTVVKTNVGTRNKTDRRCYHTAYSKLDVQGCVCYKFNNSVGNIVSVAKLCFSNGTSVGRDLGNNAVTSGSGLGTGATTDNAVTTEATGPTNSAVTMITPNSTLVCPKEANGGSNSDSSGNDGNKTGANETCNDGGGDGGSLGVNHTTIVCILSLLCILPFILVPAYYVYTKCTKRDLTGRKEPGAMLTSEDADRIEPEKVTRKNGNGRNGNGPSNNTTRDTPKVEQEKHGEVSVQNPQCFRGDVTDYEMHSGVNNSIMEAGSRPLVKVMVPSSGKSHWKI